MHFPRRWAAEQDHSSGRREPALPVLSPSLLSVKCHPKSCRELRFAEQAVPGGVPREGGLGEGAAALVTLFSPCSLPQLPLLRTQSWGSPLADLNFWEFLGSAMGTGARAVLQVKGSN